MIARCLRKQVIVAGLVAVLGLSGVVRAEEVITIGLNLPLSGPRKASGLSTKGGAELLLDEVNSQGGVLIGEKRYPVRFIYADNQTGIETAVSGALKLISRDKVLGIVGPNSSSRAIPVGGIAQSFKAPMVSPTSTNPKTTADRPFVFRACFLDDFQGEVMADFAVTEFGARKAAVLFDVENAYPKGLAESFRMAFENTQGAGAVAAFESFESDYSNIGEHVKRIADSGAEVLFIPQYSNELPSIMKQVREAGWDKPVIGGDAWASADLVEQCGDLCKGLYFSAHFAANGAKGRAQDFVEKYRKKYGEEPTNHSALGYDAAGLLLTAISQLDRIDGNLFVAREQVRNALSSLKGFEGVSGLFNMDASGNPLKSAVVIRINERNEFESYHTTGGQKS